VTIQSKVPFGLLARKEPTIERAATTEEIMIARENFAEKIEPRISKTNPMKESDAYFICNIMLPSPLLSSSKPMRKKSRGVSRAKPTSNTPAERRMVPAFFIE
jgi:hypothetical protein